jgi:hypothetical protein
MYADEAAFKKSLADQKGKPTQKVIHICSILNPANKRCWSVTDSKRRRIICKQGNATAMFILNNKYNHIPNRQSYGFSTYL